MMIKTRKDCMLALFSLLFYRIAGVLDLYGIVLYGQHMMFPYCYSICDVIISSKEIVYWNCCYNDNTLWKIMLILKC